MALCYRVNAQSLSNDEYYLLHEQLNGATFSVALGLNSQSLVVTLHETQTIERLSAVFPLLKRCAAELVTHL